MAKRRHSSKAYPHYDKASLAVIHRFLAAYLVDVRHALEREKELAGNDRHMFPFSGRIKHFESIESAVLHLHWLSNQRQPHLFNLDDPRITEVLIQWEKKQNG